MRLLVLGGTVFVGKHIVEAALGEGWDVTLFHRGKRGVDLFPAVARVLGDRDGELDRLEDARWDAVIDTSGYVPRVVRASVERLAGRVGTYVFVSSLSAYQNGVGPGAAEDAPLATMPDPTIEEINGETYGPLKVLCERQVTKGFGDSALILRPGLIVGPDDPTDRFTYWPLRMATNDTVFAPGDGTDPVQFIDVRDLAAWTIDLLRSRTTGTFNAVGPASDTPMGTFLECVARGVGASPRVLWAGYDFLDEHGVSPWSDMPVWVPGNGEDAGFSRFSIAKALGAGLRLRSVEDTARDTLAWWRKQDRAPLRAGLDDARHAELVRALVERSG